MTTKMSVDAVAGPGRPQGAGLRRGLLTGLAALLTLGLLVGLSLLRGAEPRAAAGAQKTGHEDHEDHAASGGHADLKAQGGPDDTGEHAEHDGHDHDGQTEHADPHAGHDHGDGEAHDEGVTLSAEEQRNAGIAVATAGPGRLTTEISLPGQVSLNRDRVVHVVPQIPGVAREVRVTEGDAVQAGQTLAILDSSELGEAKLDYLTRINEIVCCNITVPRAKAVHDNTLKLLEFLGGNPSLEALQGFDAGAAGENLSTLVGAYAELVHARQAFEREQALHRKEISSGQDYVAAKTAYEKAAADYRAARDSAAFAVKHGLLEAEAALRAARFAARTAEQRLRIMGISETDIHRLDALVAPDHACADPNCTDCKAAPGAAEQDHYFGNGFATYEIKAPISGRVVEKHLALGEKVGEDSDIFTLADTSTVWAELTVHLKDLPTLQVGTEVLIHAQHSGTTTRARIAALSSTVDAETRTATARAVIDNADGEWRPGVFVVGRVQTAADDVSVVVPKHAVQIVADRQVVFVPSGDAFTPVPVQTGRADRERVEITAGLAAGTPFVSEGAFGIKAKLVTSALGSHAGHGH